MDCVLLVTCGSLGDLNPFVALASALVRQQVRPVLLTNSAVRREALASGLETVFVGSDESLGEMIRRRPQYMSLRGGPLVMREMFIPASGILHDATGELIKKHRPAAIVCHPGCFGAVWAAWKADVPLAMMHMSPASLFNHNDALAYGPLVQQLFTPLIWLGIRTANRWLRPAAKAAAIPWDKGLLLRTMQGSGTILAMWPEWFRGPVVGDLPGLRFCGFPASPFDQPLSAELEEFLADGEAPIVFALGSTAVHVAGKILSLAGEVCRILGRRGVIVTGSQEPPSIGGDILAVPSTPFAALFPRSAAVVHHGGIGTMATALRAGVPALALPFGHDQFYNAARLKALGCGDSLWQRRASTHRMAWALDKLLSPAIGSQARDIANRIRSAPDGANSAAQVVKILIDKGLKHHEDSG